MDKKNIEIRFNKKIIVNGGITMLVVHSLFLDRFLFINYYLFGAHFGKTFTECIQKSFQNRFFIFK